MAPQGSGSSDLAALWDTRELEDGKYVLRSKLNRRHRPTLVTQKRTVRVNGQPEARADAAVAGTGSIRVRFDGSDSIDRGGKVVSWDWAFEDPLAEESGQENVAQGRIVEHAYQEPGNYAVTLTVHDRRGGESTGYYMLRLTQDGQVFNAQLAPETTCECDTMGVKRTGNIEGPREISFDYDGRDKRIERVPDTQRRKVGPYNDGLPVGSKQLDKRKEFFTVVCRFEAIATLTGGSAPAACAEGQRLQAVITYGPVQRVWGTPRASDPRYDSGKDPDDPYDPGDDPKVAEQFGLGGKETGRYAPCLPGSETWCDDDYHGGGAADGTGIIGQSPPNSRKRYQGNRILWLDSPGFPLLEGRAIAAGGANYIANYEAQVGRCKCSWKVEIRINRNFEVTKNEVTEVVCNRPPAAF